MNVKPILIVPIEVKAREFYSRLYFSAKAVHRNYTVLIGKSKYLHQNLRDFPKGIIFENDVTPKGYRFIAYARALGHGVVAWDEEAIVTLSDEIYADYRVAEKTLERVSILFTRGPGDTAAVAKKYPRLEHTLRPVGNPRFDILRPRFFPHQEARSGKNDNIILFNSRFASVNPFYISAERARRNRLSKFGLLGSDAPAARAIHRWLDHEEEAFVHCRKLVAALAEAFPQREIVIRPHPSEGHAAWEEIAKRYTNCRVRGDGSAIDWIMKADVLVHNSCTTAIEANLLGVPTISFLPNYDEMCDNYLTNLIGPQCADIPSVIDSVRATSLGGSGEITTRSDAARSKYSLHIAGLTNTDASDAILDEIEKAELGAESWPWRLGVLSESWKTELKRSVKQLIKADDDASPTLLRAREGYQTQKFAATDKSEMAEALNKFDIGPKRIEPFADQWFRISNPAAQPEGGAANT